MKQKWFNPKSGNFKAGASFVGGVLIVFVTMGFMLSSCGPQAFVPGTNSSFQKSPGNMLIPAKVDIVMGISQTGTMKNIFPGIQQDVPSFVKGLQNSGWDYRFITIPLTEYTNIKSMTLNKAVSVSQYDTNTPQKSWLPPFPGASYTDPKLKMDSSLFSDFFVFPGSIDPNYNDAHESGLLNQQVFLNRFDVQSKFLRPDALLAIITVSNADDRSGGKWKQEWNGEQWYPPSPDNLNKFQQSFIDVKGDAALVKYYSLVAHLNTNCRGYGSWSGLRYESVASALGTKPVDICSNSLPTSLGRVAADLQSQKLKFRRRYLIIGTEPNPSTIKVTKYTGGNQSQAQTIPEDAANGWTYIGFGTVMTIDAPIAMDQQTGYVIELHGTAKLQGEDTAHVNYMNKGAGNSK